jgi:hypothetical protein
MLNVIKLNVVMRNVIILSVFKPNVMMLSVVLLNVVAPYQSRNHNSQREITLKLFGPSFQL